MNPDATIFVVDDEPSVRKALARLLCSAGYRVETFASGSEFLGRSSYPGVGCVVLDLHMPGASGFDVQQALGGSCVLPVIFVTGHGDIPASVRAMKAGAVDFLAKPFSDVQLLEGVERALAQCRHRLKERALLAEISSRIATLTLREREVFHGVVAGKLNKQIAAELGTVEKTIKVHRARVMQKMKAQSLADLVRMSARVAAGESKAPAAERASGRSNGPALPPAKAGTA